MVRRRPRVPLNKKKLHVSNKIKIQVVKKSCKENLKISAAPPLHGEVSKTCKKKVDTKADDHISGTKANKSTTLARRPTNQQIRHEGRH
jgi:hypothetical protein